MSKHYLPHPRNPEDSLFALSLIPRQRIYKAWSSDEHFVLRAGDDGKRWLFEIDVERGVLRGNRFPIPDDWPGDPRVIAMAEATWFDIEHGRMGPAGRQLFEQLLVCLLDGDTMWVIGDRGEVVEYFRVKRFGDRCYLLQSTKSGSRRWNVSWLTIANRRVSAPP